MKKEQENNNAYTKLKARHEALERRHRQLDGEVSKLENRAWLSADDDRRRKQMKKEKIWTRDRIMSIIPKIED